MRLILATLVLSACTKVPVPIEDAAVGEAIVAPVVEEEAIMEGGDCSQAKNVCPDYSTSWVDVGQPCASLDTLERHSPGAHLALRVEVA